MSTCASCRWWGLIEPNRDWGADWVEEDIDGKRMCALTRVYRGETFHPTKAEAAGGWTGESVLYTAPDFGCNQWERKDGT